VENADLVRGRSVLEIGAGTGLCGLVAARLAASEVSRRPHWLWRCRLTYLQQCLAPAHPDMHNPPVTMCERHCAFSFLHQCALCHAQVVLTDYLETVLLNLRECVVLNAAELCQQKSSAGSPTSKATATDEAISNEDVREDKIQRLLWDWVCLHACTHAPSSC
jgi:hypothetical protein